MVASLLLLLLTQLPATPGPGEAQAGCLCKEEVTVEAAHEAAKLVEKVAAHIRGERDVSRRGELDVARKGDDAVQATASDCSEPIQCTGQLHHVISRPIAGALEKHKILKGQYEPRDKRFVTRAVDEKAHCGYQKWHRDVDEEVVEWLKRNREATAEQFEAMLRLIYNRPDMLARFPNGF